MTRRVAVLATLAGGAGLGAVAAGTWVTARAWTPLDERDLDVRGLDAAPVLGAAALLLLAAGLALGLAGRRAARATGVAVAAAGMLAVASALTVLRDPAGPARAAAQEALGVGRVQDAAATALPWAGLVVAAVLVLLGVWVTAAAGSWGGAGARGGARYRRVTDGPADGPTDRPTHDPASRPATGPGPDDVATWDAQTRGEDPT